MLGGVAQPGLKRPRQPQIDRQVNEVEPILAAERGGLVAAAVVDEDEGEGVVWQAVDDGARPFVELGQDGFFVIAGDEDIYLFHRLSPPAAARFRRTV